MEGGQIMMAKKLTCLCLLLFLIVSCGYYEGVVQPTPRSYISFMGNTDGATAVIDDTITLNLDMELQGDEGKKKPVLFQITPGKHNLIVTKMGQQVVNRVIIIGDGATKEIHVP
jgi:hypothetical protein